MKHIVFFTPSLNIGGIERVFLTYAEALIQKGYEVSYLVKLNNGDLSALVPTGVKVYALGEPTLTKAFVPLIRFFKKNPIDIFITGGEIPNSLSILAHAFAGSKSKIVISHHNYFNVEVNIPLRKLLIQLFYNRADKIISVSKGISALLLSRGVDPNKIVTLYNPIDILQIEKNSNALSTKTLPPEFLLMLGRLSCVKNIPFLINSFNLLLAKRPNLELLILGDGSMKAELELQVSQLNLDKKIHFWGAIENPFNVLKQASAIVLTSTSEALPTVILESFALGKTVISTPTQGALDLLKEGEFGYISKSFSDAKEFALLMDYGLNNPISIEILRKNAMTFDIEAKVSELIAIIENA